MKKLIAAALTGALVLGTVGTTVVFADDDDDTDADTDTDDFDEEYLKAFSKSDDSDAK